MTEIVKRPPRSELDEANERIDKRFSHVEDDPFMSLIKTWVKEILKEMGC